MFCRKCGANIDDNSKFCSNCGNVIDTPEAEQIYNQNSGVNPQQVQPANNSEDIKTEPINNVTDPANAEIKSEPIQDNFNNNQFNTANYAQNYSQPAYNNTYYTNSTAAPAKPNGRSGCAIASLILSLISLPACCCNIYVPFMPLLPILAILSIILGILGLKSNHKGMAVTGIIIGGIGVLMYVMLLLFFYLTPTGQEFQNSLWQQMRKAFEEAKYNS